MNCRRPEDFNLVKFIFVISAVVVILVVAVTFPAPHHHDYHHGTQLTYWAGPARPDFRRYDAKYQQQVIISGQLRHYFRTNSNWDSNWNIEMNSCSQKSSNNSELDFSRMTSLEVMLNLKSINDATVVKISTRCWLQLLLKEFNVRSPPNYAKWYPARWFMVDVIDPDIRYNDDENVNQNASTSVSIMDAVMGKYEKYLNVMPDRIQMFEDEKKEMIAQMKNVSKRLNTFLNQFDINFDLNFDNTTFLSIDCWKVAGDSKLSEPQHCGFDNYLIWQISDNSNYNNDNKDSTGLHGINYFKAE